jgi:hypothetical protein
MIEAMKQALEALEKISMGGDPRWADDVMPALRQAIEQAEKNDLERLRDENERLHIENRRLIDRIEVMGVPVGVGGYLTTTTTPQPQQAEKQEPVAWQDTQKTWVDVPLKNVLKADYERGFIDGMQKQMQSSVDKAVNAMSKREWVGLTDEERREAWLSREAQTPTTFAQDIEDKLKEKNGC